MATQIKKNYNGKIELRETHEVPIVVTERTLLKELEKIADLEAYVTVSGRQVTLISVFDDDVTMGDALELHEEAWRVIHKTVIDTADLIALIKANL
jgi:hypothetical protein